VPQLLEPAGEERVAGNETAVILEHAQRLASPVGAGVDDPSRVHRLGGLGKEQRDVQDQRRRGVGGCAPEVAVAQPEALELAAQLAGFLEQGEQHLVGGQAALLGDGRRLRAGKVEDSAGGAGQAELPVVGNRFFRSGLARLGLARLGLARLRETGSPGHEVDAGLR
jgi:hypothetical protein